MPVFQNIIASLHARFFPEADVTFTVRTTPRIAHFIMPIVERLIDDDGERDRCALVLWFRWDEPPLTLYQGTASLCRISRSLITDEETPRPAGGWVETPGLTARLSSEEAQDLDNCLKMVIEKTIRDWADKTNRGHWKILSQHQYQGSEDA